jgi:hypothetical protein
MNKEEQYESLRNELNKGATWPQLYMFKFIIPADNKKLALVESKFSDKAVITQKASAQGKYISITIKEVMESADAIIVKYKEMETIDGLMSL